MLLLDEPTASLDPAATKAIEDVIRKVAACAASKDLVTLFAGDVSHGDDEVGSPAAQCFQTYLELEARASATPRIEFVAAARMRSVLVGC